MNTYLFFGLVYFDNVEEKFVSLPNTRADAGCREGRDIGRVGGRSALLLLS